MRILFALLVLCAACQEDPGVIAVQDDAGHFVRYDAGDGGDAGDDHSP